MVGVFSLRPILAASPIVSARHMMPLVRIDHTDEPDNLEIKMRIRWCRRACKPRPYRIRFSYIKNCSMPIPFLIESSVPFLPGYFMHPHVLQRDSAHWRVA